MFINIDQLIICLYMRNQCDHNIQKKIDQMINFYQELIRDERMRKLWRLKMFVLKESDWLA